MAIGSRLATCDIPGCGAQLMETEFGMGFPNWMQLNGVKLNGVPNPMLCPHHVHVVMTFIDSLTEVKAP